MGMDQYLLIPFLGGWTSIYQLFWCSPGVQRFDTLPYISRSFWRGKHAHRRHCCWIQFPSWLFLQILCFWVVASGGANMVHAFPCHLGWWSDVLFICAMVKSWNIYIYIIIIIIITIIIKIIIIIYIIYWLVGWIFFMFPYIGNFIIPTDFHIFQRGRYTTNQYR